jgi:hypothetical protein
MKTSLTIFKNLFAVKTDQRMDFDSFNEFEKLLYKLSNEPLASKKDAVLISPATYVPDTTRKNDNVLEWSGWCAVDVDDFKFEGDLKSELIKRFGHYNFVCYSTASSTTDLPKFRLVFPLTKAVPNSKIKGFWFSLQTELGDLGDKQTKDLSRMYYIPAEYNNAFNFIFSNNNGSAIDPDELMFKHPMPEKTNLNSFFDRLPDEMQRQIIEYRKNKLDAEYNWSSYRDCPFFPKKLETEYRAISNTGWYHKMYQIMVAIAGNAIKNKYPITVAEISQMCRELDGDTGNWYKNRPMDKEADRALEYVYKNL